jgi:hypothetical protein
VILVVVQDEGVTPAAIESCFVESGLSEFVYRGSAESPLPTLRSMIDADERVFVMTETGAAGVSWIHSAFELMQETPYSFHDPSEFSCEQNRGPASAPLFQLNHWIDTPPAALPSNAMIVNARGVLLERARKCQQERGRLPNILAVDFYRTGDLFEVAAELNGVARTP